MRVVVVCGLLGAGKTTFILNRLKAPSAKTVVIVNDFGQAGIDGEVLSAGGFQAVELPSGCICCTLASDLITTIKKVIGRFSPEELIIEPSGIASPSGVLNSLDALSIKDVTVIGIIDATEFPEIYEADFYGPFFREQVSLADILVMNKTDLASAQEIAKTEQVLGLMNPGAPVLRAVKGAVPAGHFADMRSGLNRKNNMLSFLGHSRHLDFESVSLELGGHISHGRISAFMDEIKRGFYGDVVRAKGLLNTEEGAFKFDLSYGKVNETKLERTVERSRLVIIGTGLKRPQIKAALS